MSDNPYEIAKGGRLSFKGGALASRSTGIDKKAKKKKKDKKPRDVAVEGESVKEEGNPSEIDGAGEVIYTIDAAKKMKYEDIFPVETKKFGFEHDPKAAKQKSVEEALHDRIKKKADRYCK